MRSEIESVPVVAFADDASKDLPLHTWSALPVLVRVQDRLAEILMLVDDLHDELNEETAGALRWVDVEVEAIGEKVETLLDRLAS